MKVACLLKDYSGLMFCELEQAQKDPEVKRILTKRQFFNHHMPRKRGLKDFFNSLYKE